VKDPVSALRINGERGLAHPVYRETGANVIETMAGVRTAIEEINETYLEDADLYLTQVYDETTYINSALELVRQNIWVGGSMAAILLLIFLRSGAATLVVSLAIPVSVIGSFVAMAALGRSINVISLAGLAFSVGMVVDAAIVVLENIYRMRQQGLSVSDAAYRGAQQVWGAILVSALTTVMVFIPILIMELEVGQLFRDIAVAISVSVLLSLLVAVTVIPALASRLLGGNIQTMAQARKLPVIDHFGRGFVRLVMAITGLAVRSKSFALAMVVLLTGLCSVVTVVMLPKLDGFAVCRRLRAESCVPIIFLSAVEAISERVAGLDLGADDYLPKPFSPKELEARIATILRRVGRGNAVVESRELPTGQGVLRLGDLVVDTNRRQVTRGSERINLTYTEFSLLELLFRDPGHVVPRAEILEQLWGYPPRRAADLRVVDVYVARLRGKLEPDPRNPELILTVRGIGYASQRMGEASAAG